MTETATDVLERDHLGIQELFERVSSPDEDRAGVLRVLVERLVAHVAVERAVVLHELQKVDEHDAGLHEALLGDYHVIEHNAVRVERRKANSPDVPELVTEMLDVFTAHVERCQKQLYPDLERCLDESQLADLGERLQSADDVVLVHAHPHLQSLGPVSRLLTRFAAKLDRARGAGAWGGLSATSNDNSSAHQAKRDPVDGSVDPPPWRDPEAG